MSEDKSNATSTEEPATTKLVNGDSNINGTTDHEDVKPATENDKKEEEPDKTVVEEETYTVKIVAPGVDTFELQVSSLELVQEIHQVLMDREDTCYRTCFSLQLDGQTLDNFAELKAIENLKEGSEIKVVEENYSVREARNHVKHTHDLLRSVEYTDAYLGREQMSLSFLGAITGPGLLEEKKNPRQLDQTEIQPPDYLLPTFGSTVPTSTSLPLSALHPLQKEGKPPQCLRQLTYNNWNPPPSNRRLHGDLVYLCIHTIEEKRLHITACPKGFFINQSTEEVFNPRPAAHPYLSHSLVSLLRQVSPGFKRGWELLLKRRTQKHPFERVPAPYQLNAWLSPVLEHGVDSIRKEEAFCSKMAYEENLPGQTREWNEELQATRELPQTMLHERLLRDRAIFKSNSDFVAAATRASVSIVNGNIMAINPGEGTNQRMFIWNNMFFSLGFDVKDHYKQFGGDAAAYVATLSDLNGVRAYSTLDQSGLYTLGTAVVDYRGYRITAQTIIPGILEKEQEQSVVYGSIDFGKTVVTCDKYTELLEKTAALLKIKPHVVLDNKDEEKSLFSSVECKGIIGNDNRRYILDLLRTFPPDVNYLAGAIAEDEMNPELVKMGFPINHRHKLATLRQELVEAFIETRYLIFLRLVAIQIQQNKAKKAQEKIALEDVKSSDTPASTEPSEGVNGDSEESLLKEAQVDPSDHDEKEIEEAKKLVEENKENEDLSAEIISKSAKAVGSLHENRFSMALNPDVYQEHIRFPDPESDDLKRDKELVRDACEFLVLVQIPRFIQDCLEQNLMPQDGQTLTEALHQRGINMRYLGRVVERLAQFPTLNYLHDMAVGELLTRAVKHLFQSYLQTVETMTLAPAIAHFLNCYLSSFPSPHVNSATEENIKVNKKNKKKKGVPKAREITETQQWMSESPASLWSKINNEIKEYFHYDFDCQDIDSLMGIQRATLLRSFCISLGVQLALRDYNFEQRQRQTFNDEDIMSLFPVVKHLEPQASDAYNFFTTGQAKISQGQLQEGHELVSEALSLLNNVYGPLHPDIAACNRLLARLSYVMGDHSAAVMFQQRAAIISERVHGVDSPHTTAEYGHLALYCFACGQIGNALQLMYRARYIALLCHGEVHPEMPVIDTNIGLMLHAAEEYEKSLLFLENALNLTKRFFGNKSLKTAMAHHLLARAQSCRGDFRAALQYEKECFSIYKDKLGAENDRTKESGDCLSHLTQQAVTFAKKMTELTKGEARDPSMFSPIQIQTPSHTNLLETLNVVNGIFFIQLSNEDISRYREEMASRQAEADAFPPSDDVPTPASSGDTVTIEE